jgi:hypothetical protein
MKKVITILKILGVVLLVGVVLYIGVASAKAMPALIHDFARFPKYGSTNEFDNYRIIDGNLSWKETDRIIGTDTDYSTSPNMFHTYKRIKGEDPERFVGAYRYNGIIFKTHEFHVVLVSPEYRFDLWKDWTVSGVELLYVDEKTNDNNDPSDYRRVTIFNSSDGKVFDDLTTIIKNNIKAEAPITLNAEKPRLKDTGKKVYNYGIRVHFDESDSIIWDAELHIYSSGEHKEAYIDYGEDKRFFLEVVRPYAINGNYLLEIPEDSELYKLIREAIYG